MAEEQKDTQAAAPEAQTVEEGSLLDDIVTATKLKPADEGYDIAKKGVEALLSQLV